MMSDLICTLGTSPAIVLEAIFANGLEKPYRNVFCITTETNDSNIEIIRSEIDGLFNSRITLSFKKVSNFSVLRNQQDHQQFQEALYAYYLECSHGKDKEDIHVCISGGYKTMTAALQKAAHLFGAGRVFHVFADEYAEHGIKKPHRFPETVDEIVEGYRTGQIRVIDLGREPGRSFIVQNTDQIQESESRSLLIESLLAKADATTENLDRFDTLPFASLAGLDPTQLNSLTSPLRNWLETDIIEQLPKIELHCHLGGFATHGDELKVVRAAAEYPDILPENEVPPYPDNWPEPDYTIDLNSYRKLGDATGSTILSDPGCLKKHIELLYRHLQLQKVEYAEIRCSPNNYTQLGYSAMEMLSIIRETFDHLMEDAQKKKEWETKVNLIIIVTRKKSGDLSAISRHLALAVAAFDPGGLENKCEIVGVDLAGFEDENTRPQYFQTDFDLAHRTGLAVTAHAGENDDVESIWQAVFKLNARRLGHALRLSDATDLLRAVIDRNIGIEMCPYANYQIVGFYPMENTKRYPLTEYLKQGVKVTVNTDNIGISKAGLSGNIRFLSKLLPEFTLLQVLQLQRNAVDVSFTDYREKQNILKLMNLKTYEVIRKYLS